MKKTASSLDIEEEVAGVIRVKNAIRLSGVSKSFVRNKLVLNNIFLDVNQGEMVALIGASGSGKSTLIRLLCGLERINGDPDAEIAMFGETTQKSGERTASLRKLRRDIGVIFQQFNLVGRLSLLSNVLAGRLGRAPSWRGTLGAFSRDDKLQALAALERVGMIEYARQRASTLSGGQQQRGAIARALTQNARLILADEPIASLDPASADRVMETLGRINAQDKVTVVVSLHQIDHAFHHCSRIVALKNGEIAFDGKAADISPDEIASLYGAEASDATHTLQGSSNGYQRPVPGNGRATAPTTAALAAAQSQ